MSSTATSQSSSTAAPTQNSAGKMRGGIGVIAGLAVAVLIV